jgi:chromosome segregation ATPase
MRLDDLPEAFGDFLETADAVIRSEVGIAKKARDALSAEKAKMQTAVDELQDQHKAAKKQLDDVLANLQKGTTLAGLNHDIGEAKKTLEKLKAEVAKTETAFEAVEKELKAAERERDTVRSEMQRLAQQGSEATAELGCIRSLFQSFETRRSA